MYLILLLISIILSVIFYRFVIQKNNYWENKKIPYLRGSFLFGNYKDYILLRRTFFEIAHEICQKFPDEPMIGTYYGTKPALLVQDPELVRQVMVNDFYYFSGREVCDYSSREFGTRNFFFQAGDLWKLGRHNLTPVFSSAKLKKMIYLVNNCCASLEKHLKRQSEITSRVEVKDLMSKFTMDCIGSCIFGIDIGLLEKVDEANPFTIIARKIFQESVFGGFTYMCRSIWPDLFYALGLRMYDTQLCNFFQNLLTGIFKQRQNSKEVRNDFIDYILSWKNDTHISAPRLSKDPSTDNGTVKAEVTENLLVGQCIILFAGGYDTTAINICYTIYELAKNKEIQSKVLREVDEYFSKNSNIQYEALTELPYLEACFSETHRMYPIGGVLPREVAADYTFSNGLTLEKGLRVHVPVYHIHHNPRFHPDPKLFRPERFLGDDKRKIIPYTFMPFGCGPRNCLGVRLAKMMMTSCLLTILKDFELELDEDTPRTLKFNPNSFNTKPINKINIKFIPRNKIK